MDRKNATTAPTVSQFAFPYTSVFCPNNLGRLTHEHGFTTSIPDPVSENVEDDHVENKDDEGDQCSEGSSERHHDGSEPGCCSDTNDTKDDGDESKSGSDGVKDETVAQSLKDTGKLVDGSASQPHFHIVINNIIRDLDSLVGTWDGEVVTDRRLRVTACLPDYALGKDTIDRVLASNGSIEEVDLVPHGGRDGNENKQSHGRKGKEKSWECWGNHLVDFGCGRLRSERESAAISDWVHQKKQKVKRKDGVMTETEFGSDWLLMRVDQR